MRPDPVFGPRLFGSRFGLLRDAIRPLAIRPEMGALDAQALVAGLFTVELDEVAAGAPGADGSVRASERLKALRGHLHQELQT